MGVAALDSDANKHEDSFERHYNKDLDLDEGNILDIMDRLSTNCHLRAQRVSHQLHFSRII